MRIVELVSSEKQFPIGDEACMEPEVESTVVVTLRHRFLQNKNECTKKTVSINDRICSSAVVARNASKTIVWLLFFRLEATVVI